MIYKINAAETDIFSNITKMFPVMIRNDCPKIKRLVAIEDQLTLYVGPWKYNYEEYYELLEDIWNEYEDETSEFGGRR